MLKELASRTRRPRAPRLIALASAVAALALLPAAAQADSGNHNGQVAKVMTRNLFLGADLSPAIGATSLNNFVEGNGLILRQLAATNFPVRAKGLAEEILSQEPDLVGLQEVALWRTGPASILPVLGGPKTATTVRYDFLQILLDELNAGRAQPLYEAVMVQPEFDMEAPANENLVSGDGAAPIGNAELNARLTMRDVILARTDNSSVKVRNPQGGHFAHLLTLPILGNPVTVTRGWTAVDAKVRGTGWFRFVNTHLEAFDQRSLVPSIRSEQARELVAPGGPAAKGDLPVVLVGDLNSDDDTVGNGDEQAYNALLAAGLVERSTNDPLSCCIHSFNLQTGTDAQFDHQVDHVLTDSPDSVTLVDSAVTGREMHNGWWDSDHAGLASALLIR